MKIVLPRSILRLLLWTVLLLAIVFISFVVLGRWFLVPLCFGSGASASKEFCATYRENVLQVSLQMIESKWTPPHPITDNLKVSRWYIEGNVFVFEYSTPRLSVSQEARSAILSKIHDWICNTQSAAKYVSQSQRVPNLHIVTFLDRARFTAAYSPSVCDGSPTAEWERLDGKGK